MDVQNLLKSKTYLFEHLKSIISLTLSRLSRQFQSVGTVAANLKSVRPHLIHVSNLENRTINSVSLQENGTVLNKFCMLMGFFPIVLSSRVLTKF